VDGHTHQHDRLVLILQSSYQMVFSPLIGYTPAIYAPVLTFVAFAIQARIRGSEPLSTNQALTSLSIVTLMTQPASLLLTAIPETLASIGCFERIQAFLLKPSWMDQRGSLRNLPSVSKKPSSQGSDGDSEVPQIPSDGQSESITLEKMAVGNGKAESMGNAIDISNLSVKPCPSSELALKGITLQLLPDTLTILAGPVGSGKSTLLKVMLGEIPKESGNILMPPCDIAYCPQSPWIMNTSILQNICGVQKGAAVNEQWYRAVLHACALEEDMKQLPDGDLSVPGSRGLTLSGGQKQRVVCP
jgi:ATP-binding cassette, subfamily C (CFTR/MRP), member 1